MSVCFVRIMEVAEASAVAMAMLDADECRRASMYRQQADRYRFAVGRYAARNLVATVVGIDPASIAIRSTCLHCGATDHGKPRAEWQGGTTPVSISHADAKVLVAATDGAAVGADIELVDPNAFTPALLDQIASTAERAAMPCTVSAFTRLWTLKEAALKCTGDGLMVSPRSFTIDVRSDPPLLFGGEGRLRQPIALRAIDSGDGYMAAVAVATAGRVDVLVA